MSITRADVEAVALLARLRLSEEELQRLTGELGEIVAYVDQLAALDTEGVEPMAHALDVINVFRPDEPRDSIPREQALAGAPQSDGECFLVPAVLGD